MRTKRQQQTDADLADAARNLYREIDTLRRQPRNPLQPSDHEWITARLADLYRQLKPIQQERTRRTGREPCDSTRSTPPRHSA